MPIDFREIIAGAEVGASSHFDKWAWDTGIIPTASEYNIGITADGTLDPDARVDPFKNSNFILGLQPRGAGTNEGLTVYFGVKSISGLEVETESSEYRESADRTKILSVPGNTRFTDLVVNKACTESKAFFKWMRTTYRTSKDTGAAGVLTYNDYRAKQGFIILRNQFLKAVRCWVVIDPWCTRWRLGDLDATGNEVLMEEFTIKHEGLVEVTIDTATGEPEPDSVVGALTND